MTPSGLKELHGCRLISTIRSVVSDLNLSHPSVNPSTNPTALMMGMAGSLFTVPLSERWVQISHVPKSLQSKWMPLNIRIRFHPDQIEIATQTFWYLPACLIILFNTRGTFTCRHLTARIWKSEGPTNRAAFPLSPGGQP